MARRSRSPESRRRIHRALRRGSVALELPFEFLLCAARADANGPRNAKLSVADRKRLRRASADVDHEAVGVLRKGPALRRDVEDRRDVNVEVQRVHATRLQLLEAGAK